jgi:hypothetical protein
VTEQIRVILMGPPGAGMGIGTLQLDLYELC